MSDRFRETAGNLNTGENVQDSLNPAEQAAAEVLAERHNAHSTTEHLAVAAFAGEALAVVEAVRGPLWRELGDRIREDWPRSAHYWHKIYRLAAEAENPTVEYVPELAPCSECAARQSGEGQH